MISMRVHSVMEKPPPFGPGQHLSAGALSSIILRSVSRFFWDSEPLKRGAGILGHSSKAKSNTDGALGRVEAQEIKLSA